MNNAESYEEMLSCEDPNTGSPKVIKLNETNNHNPDDTKENTHIVIKREDVLNYLSDIERYTLKLILDKIGRERCKDGKKPFNNYYICNTDEPYAEFVHKIIVYEEALK